MFKILIVEDELEIRELLGKYLENADYKVLYAGDGITALKLFHKESPNVIILDRMLPDLSGDQICTEIRKISDVPIMMLTAKSDVESRIEGFELGVDDYVTKPFSAKEVLFRVNVLIKRGKDNKLEKVYKDSIIKIQFESRVISVCDVEIHLTANEWKLMETLYDNKGRPLTRSQLVTSVFGQLYEAYDRNIDTYIKNIRQKIEPNLKSPIYIKTKYGIGYYFGGE